MCVLVVMNIQVELTLRTALTVFQSSEVSFDSGFIMRSEMEEKPCTCLLLRVNFNVFKTYLDNPTPIT